MITLTEGQTELLSFLVANQGDDFRPDYSGRGMYGRTCIGIVSDDVGQAMTTLIRALMDEDTDLAESLSLNHAAQDTMGRQEVVYWPMLRAEEG